MREMRITITQTAGILGGLAIASEFTHVIGDDETDAAIEALGREDANLMYRYAHGYGSFEMPEGSS